MKYSLVLAGLAATAYAIPKHHTKSTKIKTTKQHKTTTTSKIATTTSVASSTIPITVVAPASSSASTSASPSASPSAAPAPSGCVVTDFAAIPAAVANCTSITLKDIHAPSNQTIDLQKLLPHTTVTFAGTTTFDFTNISSFDPIVISGTDITVTAEPDALLDGNGPIYWDGIGSNGGVPKPNHFIVLKKINGGVVKDLKIKNWPVHLFSISGCNNVDMFDLYLDNTDGNAPNNRSKGLPAAHNSDGFDLSSSTNFTIRDSVVLNQDDCVAVTSGDNVKVDNMYCDGGHGLSIGSVGGKSNNNVTNISFTNSVVLNSENGPRIKTNSNTTGFISDITYRNITVSNISIYGIDVQQDYLNGGPTGSPTNGVIIQNVLFEDIKGTANEDGKNYYVLCGEGSCSNIKFVNVDITSGGKPSSCNLPADECPVI
ncbi:glycosyl hydrolases family 28-domain-containing protein [Elsinoe ampelina]|uniref:endo-polygalacturonase n=1 Tax=Elsinoe ampelina TaxID=302913 RepID=A0A6A6G960_9PEZI|nr:glycosyl hydrolases family 28-domain-containing protein [Elsinoe ampelina]